MDVALQCKVRVQPPPGWGLARKIVAEIEADMAAQLARVREMERNGELEPNPEVSAATE